MDLREEKKWLWASFYKGIILHTMNYTNERITMHSNKSQEKGRDGFAYELGKK